MKSTKKLLILFILFFASLVVIDFGAGLFLDHLFDSLPESANECGKVHSRFTMEKDVVLMGSSRCRHHFVSSQLIDSINNYHKGLSIYNFGLDGFFLNSSLCAVESMLGKYTPKIVIIEAETSSFLESDVYAKGITSYAPLFDKDTVVKRYINSLDVKNKFLYQSHLVRYGNAYPLKLIKTMKLKEDNNLGYEPLKGSKLDVESNNDNNNSNTKTELCQFTFNNFRRVSKLCKDKGVLLIVVSTPYFKPNEKNDIIRTICEAEDVFYLDYYNSTFFNSHPELFYDVDHLNSEGAIVFSEMFFNDLKKYLFN